MDKVKEKRPVFVVLWMVLLVLGTTVRIVWDILWRFPKLSVYKRQEALQQWALKLLSLMDVSLEQQGIALSGNSCLRAANHVSWLDIVVLYACSPCRFIAKSEIERFPLVGRIAKNAGTLFLKRGSIKDAIRMSRDIGNALKQGDCVAFFPEGTTSDGEGILPLHASLFEGAIYAHSNVQAVVLRFHTAHSTRACVRAAYVNKTSMLKVLWRVLRMGGVHVLVVGMEPIEVTKRDERRKVCAQVQEEMENTLNRLNYNRTQLAIERNGRNDDKIMNQIDDELRSLFYSEAQRLITNGTIALQKLNVNATNRIALIKVRQSFHVLKGSARMVGMADFGRAALACEQCLDSWIIAKKSASKELINFIDYALNELDEWLKDLMQDHVGSKFAADFEAAANSVKAA